MNVGSFTLFGEPAGESFFYVNARCAFTLLEELCFVLGCSLVVYHPQLHKGECKYFLLCYIAVAVLCTLSFGFELYASLRSGREEEWA